MNRYLLAIFCFCTLALTSCVSSKQNDLAYFKNIDSCSTVLGKLPNEYAIKVIPDDELIISVFSTIPEATAAYNVPMVNPATRSSVSPSSQPTLQTYVVDQKGNIMFPVLGKLHVQGMSTEEISDMIRTKVSADVQDPYVKVKLSNFRVNVLGEVKKPGAMEVTKERYTVLDAIAEANDLTEFGRRDNVLLIRDENGVRTYHRLNLNDASLLTSPYYYLQQNDVVYVEPNKIRQDNSKYNQNNAFKLSVVSTIVSAASIIASLVIALTVKNN
jgi:polysaccharide export outer membrane protein